MSTPTDSRPLLDVHGLRVAYGGVVAVSDVDLQIAEGTVFGLIGPNGAGKTSMIDALTGYTKPRAGAIVFDGRDISGMRPYRRARLGGWPARSSRSSCSTTSRSPRTCWWRVSR